MRGILAGCLRGKKRKRRNEMEENYFNPFVKSGDVPPIVYKYRDWNNFLHQRTLTDSELFLSSPSRFNDPYDCKIPVAYFLLEGNRKMQEKYFYELVQSNFPDLSEYDKTIEAERLIKEARYSDPKWIKWADDEFIKNLGEKFGVIALTPVNNNILMWAHYSNSHTGFCIGFHSEILFNKPDEFGSGGPVSYQEKYPLISPLEDYTQQMIMQMYYKSKIWEYEKEYRLSKFGAADKIVKFDRNSVAEIIIGSNASLIVEEQIIDIVKTNFGRIPVKKAFAERFDFKINFEKIN